MSENTDGILGKAGELFNTLKDKAQDVAEVVGDKAQDVAQVVGDKAEDVIGAENIQKAKDFLGTDVGEIAANIQDQTGKTFEELKEKADELVNDAKSKLDKK
jgi:DNA-binding ferritin-like protein (Dps family)